MALDGGFLQHKHTRNTQHTHTTHTDARTAPITLPLLLNAPPPPHPDTPTHLRRHVARRQRHVLERRGVPRREDDAAVLGALPDQPHDLRELVDALAFFIYVYVCMYV